MPKTDTEDVPQINEFHFLFGVEGNKGSKKLHIAFYADGQAYFIKSKALGKNGYGMAPLLIELMEYALHYAKTRGHPLRIRFENGKRLTDSGQTKDSERVREPRLINEVRNYLHELGKKTKSVVVGSFY